jgi:kynurenine 3-monooxygenase
LLLIADFLAVVMAFPLSIAFELAAGFLFGTFLGCDSDKEERRTTRTLTALLGSFSTIIIALAKVGGACVSFMLGRYFLRNWVEGMLSNSERFNKVYGSMKVDSFRIAILLRLSPFPPSWVNNYALAISPISFKSV